jgi:hypothetical protein
LRNAFGRGNIGVLLNRRALRAGAGGLSMDYNGKVKGALLLARLRFVRSLGAARALGVLTALEPEQRVLLDERRLVPTTWYAGELLQKLDDAIAAVAGNGDRATTLVAIGRHSAETSFGPTGTLRPYAGLKDPHALLREVPRVHAGLHGAGDRGYVRLGTRAAVVRAVKGHRNEGGDCLTNVGWLGRAIELCGGRDVTVLETACIGRGGSCCEFRCQWR